MSHPSAALFHVDAFADAPFAGNPAGVCLLDAPRDTRWMQGIAREMNVSETAFVEGAGPAADAGTLSLRWFTPLVEVDICGHATLAAAHVLWQTGRLGPADVARFRTRSGVLTASPDAGWIELDFPAVACEPAVLAPAYLEALGVARALSVCSAGPRHVVQVESPGEVRSLAPDFRALGSLPGRGIAVTAASNGRPYDVVSRYFAPWVGVDEDPATGSVHCALAVFWSSRLGRTELLAHQASPRGGVLRLRLEGARVRLGGKAVTVARGEVVV